MKKNPAAVALGKLGGAATKGKPKNYSPEEIQKRTERLLKAAAARRNGRKGGRPKTKETKGKQ